MTARAQYLDLTTVFNEQLRLAATTHDLRKPVLLQYHTRDTSPPPSPTLPAAGRTDARSAPHTSTGNARSVPRRAGIAMSSGDAGAGKLTRMVYSHIPIGPLFELHGRRFPRWAYNPSRPREAEPGGRGGQRDPLCRIALPQMPARI